VFGYGLAYFVLGETLSARQLLGGVLIVGGTLTVSLRFGRDAGTFKLRLVMLMLACGLALAVSSLIFKVFAITVEFWVTTFWLFVGEALFGCAILAIAGYRRQFIAALSKHPAALLTISGVNEVLNLAGGLGFRYALLFAPLSIVQAIGATTTLFVFAFGVTLSAAFPRLGRETLSARDLVQKGAAAILVAGGVALVTRA
jgi:drug/metabolite transporter (DMT)-like permease